jgi:hypothetical protein
MALASAVALNSSALAAFGIVEVSDTTPLGVQTPIQMPGPASVMPGAAENILPVIFPEVLGKTATADIPVDHDGSNIVAVHPGPATTLGIVNAAFIPGVIATDAIYNSYLFHFDPTAASLPFYISTINFENPIIGVQLFSSAAILEKPAGLPYTGTLEAGDAAVTAAGSTTIYPSGVNYRGLDEDEFSLSISGNQIAIMGIALGNQIDQVRIFTSAAVPEATSAIGWAAIALTYCGYGFYRRKIAQHLST